MKITSYLIATFFVLGISTTLLVPESVQAQGLVTCTGVDCNFCTLLDMVNGIIQWLIGILIVVAVFIAAIAGFQLVTSGGDQGALEKAKSMLTNAVIGFIIVLAAWLIVDTLLQAVAKDGAGIWDVPPGGCGYMTASVFDPSTISTAEPDDGTITMPGDVIPGAVDKGDDICFPGDGTSGETCFSKLDLPDEGDYKYKDASHLGYARPGYFIDLLEVPADTPISPNFTVGELAQQYKGRYAYIDPNLPSRLEGVRESLGVPIQINSGYRSPGYNSKLEGAAEHSRHQYGDAVDIAISGGKTAADIVAACKARGATFTKTYSGHVHCDWR